MDLAAHYHHLWETSRQGFETGKFELDPLLDNPNDLRRGLTLVARPSLEVKENMQLVLQELLQLEPEQYAYPASDLHITLLSIVSCYSGFQLDSVTVEDYASLIRESLKEIEPFTVAFAGVTASPSCVLAQGFPADDTLAQLRDRLRKVFKVSGLEQSIDARYAIQTAHATLLRFRKPLRHPQAFLQKLDELRNFSFGCSTITEAEFVYNDWYQRERHVQVLATFLLT